MLCYKSYPKDGWSALTINSSWEKTPTRRTPYVPSPWRWLAGPTHPLQQTCNNPAEEKVVSRSFCHPSQGHNCFCTWYNLLSQSDWRCVTGTQIPANALFSWVEHEIKAPQQTLPRNAYFRDPCASHCWWKREWTSVWPQVKPMAAAWGAILEKPVLGRPGAMAKSEAGASNL
jgi:hypothetical protein